VIRARGVEHDPGHRMSVADKSGMVARHGLLLGLARDETDETLKVLARICTLGLVFAFAAEAFTFASQGRSIIDEGVYLNAGRLLFEGALPYRDFPFSQAPGVAYVYGAAVHVFGPSVMVGRWVSLVLGLLGFGAAVWIARALGGRIATWGGLGLSMMNLPALWVAGTVRTQSLSTPLTMLSVLALTLPRRGVLGWALSPSLMLWATAARLTNALAFLAIAGWVAVRLRDQPRRLAGVAALVAGQALVLFAPVLMAPGDAVFHILTAQLGRGERGGPRDSSFGQELAAKFGVLNTPETSFVVVGVLTALVLVLLIAKASRGWRPDFTEPLGDPGTAQLTLILLALLVYLPHLLLNRGFLTYFVTSSVLLVPAVAIGIAERAREPGRGRVPALAVAAMATAVGAVQTPLHWGAWIGRGEASFRHFREVGAELRQLAGPDCTAVTVETALAFEAGCRLLPGLEYSFFSYFPDLGDDEAEARGVLNRSRLVSRIREIRPALIVLGSRDRGSLGLVRRWGEPASPGFLARDGYTFVDRYRISSGAFVGPAPDSVAVEVFVRNDRVGEGRRSRSAPGASP
jgi:hypothetical protein